MSEDSRRRCAHCGEVLGVYEPIVARDARGTRETSIAAEPDLQASPADLYHARCLPSAGR